jgi:inosine/xanthosine triphosphatase
LAKFAEIATIIFVEYLPSGMKAWRIAVGSTRLPKVNAVHEAVSLFAPLLDPGADFEINGYEVESGVSHTPASRAELMQGARQRAQALAARVLPVSEMADFFVGVEGGLDVVEDGDILRVFLESWAYVTDSHAGHFGCSGSIEIPAVLASEVLHRGTELSEAIDTYAGAVGIRDGKGAWGVLSGNLITRQESFRLAVLTAFAPFYNARMYRSASAAGAGAAAPSSSEKRKTA